MDKKNMSDLIWDATRQCPFCEGKDRNECNCCKCPGCGKDCYNMFGDSCAYDDGCAVCVHCGFDLENYFPRDEYENDIREAEERYLSEPCPQCGEPFEDCICMDRDEDLIW